MRIGRLLEEWTPEELRNAVPVPLRDGAAPRSSLLDCPDLGIRFKFSEAGIEEAGLFEPPRSK